ncbi:MAG TPA: hypothetical protein VHR66_30705 [Gemmataceae bacterium]|jgi:hypothetical protein|nr:hypothetical protein [Gemmataceae bacterium]
MIETVEYRGWKNNLHIANESAELIVTLDVGPRVIAYRKPGGFNVMKNYDEMMGGFGEKEWQIRGGLRFWLAPEDLTRTYFPDNRPVGHAKLGDFAARFTPPVEEAYGVQKVMEVRLDEKGSRAHIRLRVTNVGQTPTTLAPWGPTVMAPGGMEIIPVPPHKNHPLDPKNAKHPGDFAPNQKLILWPYFDFTDDRWTFGSKFIFLRQDAKKGPTKIGLGHPVPWVAYLNQGTLFVKRFRHHEWAEYPDTGTSYQTFSNEDMLEMETVGVLCTLNPGQSAELEETWELFTDVPAVKTEAEVERVIAPLVER